MVVNIHEAKTHFSRLIGRVMEGEEVVIGKARPLSGGAYAAYSRWVEGAGPHT